VRIVFLLALATFSSCCFASSQSEPQQIHLNGKDRIDFSREWHLQVYAKSQNPILTMNICNALDQLPKQVQWRCDGRMIWKNTDERGKGHVTMRISGRLAEPELNKIWSTILAIADQDKISVSGKISN